MKFIFQRDWLNDSLKTLGQERECLYRSMLNANITSFSFPCLSLWDYNKK